MNYYLKKIGLLLKKVNNPPYFIYHLFHYLNVFIPKFLGKLISKLSINDNIGINIETYDGSGQIVHPDVAVFRNTFYIVVTPYPYGMEEYENPSIYTTENFVYFRPASKNPIAKQKCHLHGWHLSDPCLLEVDEYLYCFYRENIKKNIIKSIIQVKIFDGKLWGGERTVVESDDDALLSPAFCYDYETQLFYEFHVTMDGKLIFSNYDKSFNCLKKKNLRCRKIPDGYKLWHIGIYSKERKDKKINVRERLCGLFLIRNENKYRLFYSSSESMGEEWVLGKEIIPDQSISAAIRNPYKSAFIPNSNRIVYSYIDKHNRYKAIVMEFEEA